MRRPETFRRFLDAAGKYSRLLPFNILAYSCVEKAFTVIALDTTAAEQELGRSDEHSEEEIVIIQLDLKD